MKPLDVLGSGLSEMFRARLDQIIDMGHEKVVPAQQINWQFLSRNVVAMTVTGPVIRLCSSSVFRINRVP